MYFSSTVTGSSQLIVPPMHAFSSSYVCCFSNKSTGSMATWSGYFFWRNSEITVFPEPDPPVIAITIVSLR